MLHLEGKFKNSRRKKYARETIFAGRLLYDFIPFWSRTSITVLSFQQEEETLLFLCQCHSIFPFLILHQSIDYMVNQIRLSGCLNQGNFIEEFLMS